MNQDPSRRKFLEKLSVGTAASLSLSVLPGFGQVRTAASGPLPNRILGRTGAQVSILAFGCGSRFLMYEDEQESLEVLNRAINQGITYLDTAYSYGDGKSEGRVGKVMATRRKEVWLATKIPDRTRDGFLRRLEGSLKRLQVDHVDLVHIHGLAKADDLAAIEAPDGAMKGLLEAREQKMARFIGMTSHTSGEIMAQAIEHNDLDCVQMALNASRNGRFEELALPAARKKNLGIIAMKVTGQEFLLGTGPGRTNMDALLHYSMSLPVSTAVVGMPKVEMLDYNLSVARSFSSLTEWEMQQLRDILSPSRAGLEKKLVGHLDGPTLNPGLFSV